MKGTIEEMRASSLANKIMIDKLMEKVEKRFHEKMETYLLCFYKPEHTVVREKRKDNIVICTYAQCGRILIGFYDTKKKVVYKEWNYQNSWIRPKFATLIKEGYG